MILIALGSNMGAREAALQQAVDAMAARGIGLANASSIRTTPALLPDDAPEAWNLPFLNQVIEVQTALAPQALLEQLQSIELQLGRMDRGRWGPREIDLDILVYNNEIIDRDGLTLPHPGIAARAFVLEPIAEIAPLWKHPVLKKTAKTMLDELAA